jgi:hypothetical protein
MVSRAMRAGAHDRRMSRTMNPAEAVINGLGDKRTGGIKTMRHESVEVTWTEAVIALAVLGIIAFLLQH